MASIVVLLALIGVACGGDDKAQDDDAAPATAAGDARSGADPGDAGDGPASASTAADEERLTVVVASARLAGALRNEMLLTSEVQAGVDDVDDALGDRRAATDDAVAAYGAAVDALAGSSPELDEAADHADTRLDGLRTSRQAVDTQVAAPVDTTFQYWSTIDDVIDVATAVQLDAEDAATVHTALTVADAQRLFASRAAIASLLTPLLAEASGVALPVPAGAPCTAGDCAALERINELTAINAEAFGGIDTTADPAQRAIVRDALAAGESLATAQDPLVAALAAGTPLVAVVDLDSWLAYQRDAAAGFDAGDDALLDAIGAS